MRNKSGASINKVALPHISLAHYQVGQQNLINDSGATDLDLNYRFCFHESFFLPNLSPSVVSRSPTRLSQPELGAQVSRCQISR